MGWKDTVATILDGMTDAALGVFVKPEPAGTVDVSDIDIQLAIDMVVAGADNWKIRKTIADSAGRNITDAHVNALRELVKEEQRERDLILNPPPEGGELPV